MPILMMSLNQMFNTEAKYKRIEEALQSKRTAQKYEEFELNDNGEIVYLPKNLIVVPKEKVQETLRDQWENNKVHMLGKGVTAVYKYLCTRFINITRNDVDLFLKQQTNYQLTSNPHKEVNKPIVETKPNARWQADLIDLSNYQGANRGWKYILNCVDVFSRKVFLRALRKKTADVVAVALADIIKSAGIKPKVIQTDNGTEFAGGFDNYCRKHRINHWLNNSHAPNENAIVERSNKEVRKTLRAFMLERQDTIWHKLMPQVEANLNGKWNETLGAAPDQIWKPNHEVPPAPSGAEAARGQRVAAMQRAKAREYRKRDDFKEGDRVRVKMSAIFSNMRRLLKEGNSKQLVVTYTPQVFTVWRVTQRTGALERKKYLLENADGVVLRRHTGNPKPFYASDLLLAGVGTIPDDEAELSMAEALKLNKVQPSSTDVMFA